MGYLVDDYYGTERTTAALAINGSVKGQIQYGGDQDWLAVTLKAGVTYYLTGAGSGTTGFAIAIFDPSINSWVAAHSMGYEKAGTLEFTANRNGTYYAVAMDTSDNFAINDYTLSIATRSTPDDLPSDRSTTGVLTLDTPALGLFEQAGDQDWFKFHGKKGYHYTFISEARPVDGLGSGYLYSLAIKDAYGRTVSPSHSITPLEDGDYYIEVAGFSVGGYKVIATQVADEFPNELRGAARLAAGAKVEGKIDYEMDSDWIRVDLEQGKFYTFQLQGAAGYTWSIGLHDVTGNRLDYRSGSLAEGGAQLTYLAKETGTVFLELERGLTSNVIGYPTPYSFTVASAEDDIGQDVATAKLLALGASAPGTLQFSADRDAFKVKLDAGVTYRF